MTLSMTDWPEASAAYANVACTAGSFHLRRLRLWHSLWLCGSETLESSVVVWNKSCEHLCETET
jgi:hypothetical protein